jgi:hypothetical protein
MAFTHTKKLIQSQLIRLGSGSDQKGPDPTGSGTLFKKLSSVDCLIQTFDTCKYQNWAEEIFFFYVVPALNSISEKLIDPAPAPPFINSRSTVND